jgi:hypothetical protein
MEKILISKVRSSDYSISILNGQPMVTREFKFDDGSVINFTVYLPRDDQATLPDIHKQSVAHAISLLEQTIPKK